MIDPELISKLKQRRGVVDSEGTTWAAGQANAMPTAAPLRTALNAQRNATPRGFNAATSVRCDVPPLFPVSRRAMEPVAIAGRAESELTRKLQARRGRVDSEGEAWHGHNLYLSAAPAAVSVAYGSEQALRLTRWATSMESQDFLLDVESLKLRCEPGAAETARPWEELRLGSRTWFCEIWVADFAQALCPPSPSASSEALIAGVPAVLCLAADGELVGCLPVLAPSAHPDEDGDFAKLACRFPIQRLRRLAIPVSSPQMLGFVLQNAAQSPSDDMLPAVVLARFDSTVEARSCAEATMVFTEPSCKVTDGPFAELEALLGHHALAPALGETPPRRSAGLASHAFSLSRDLPGCQLWSDQEDFLRELDALAGFTAIGNTDNF